MGKYHFKFKRVKQKKPSSNKRIVTIDTEWAKNWRAKEKFVPFCTSIHSIYLENIYDVIDIDNLYMESELYFRSKSDSTQDYINQVENMLSKYVDDNTVIVGHQISSDLHTLVQCSKVKLNTVELLIKLFKERKKTNYLNVLKVADTRYDIKNRKRGNGAEKLRNVSLRLKIIAVQNELNEMSLTKMYNQYLIDGHQEKREKLLVLNWRHAFQTGLVWLLDLNCDKVFYNTKFNANILVTNDIMLEMGKNSIKYLNSSEYAHSKTIDGILEYVKKYDLNNKLTKLLCTNDIKRET